MVAVTSLDSFCLSPQGKTSWETSLSKFFKNKKIVRKNSKPIRGCILGSTSSISRHALPSRSELGLRPQALPSGNPHRLIFSIKPRTQLRISYHKPGTKKSGIWKRRVSRSGWRGKWPSDQPFSNASCFSFFQIVSTSNLIRPGMHWRSEDGRLECKAT